MSSAYDTSTHDTIAPAAPASAFPPATPASTPAVNDEPAAEGLTRDELAFLVHELRGGLTVILGYAELLGHDLAGPDRRSALDGIERAVSRIDGLCSDALAGRPPHRPGATLGERVPLVLLAEQIVAEQQLATRRKVTFSVADGASGVSVAGSADALARMLGNLIGNAVKYSPAEAEVDVRVSAEPRAEEGRAAEIARTAGVAIVEVCDHGPGIPECARDRVFEPFERLERDAAHPGSGLGLAVVREVVAAHGGRISIADREGGGCLVRVELPIAE
ncbi:MAG: sensor histidine kinase [Coriobacteriia bacterium]